MLDPKLLMAIAGMFSGGGVQSSGVGVGAGIPSSPDMGAVGPALSMAGVNGSTPSGGGTPGGGTILGMTPAQFMSVMGQVGTAMAPDTDIGRLGQVAANMGMTQLQGILAKNQLNSFSSFAKDLVGKMHPNQMGTLASGLGKLSLMDGLPKLSNTSSSGGA